MNIEKVSLFSPSPGTQRQLLVYRFDSQQEATGKGKSKFYFQAGLHADEWPGLLVIQHLLVLLQQAEEKGLLKADFVLVPYANPIGLSQNVFGYVTGRFDLVGTGNFNRNFGDLYLATRNKVEDYLGPDKYQNTLRTQRALLETVSELPAEDEVTALKKTLLSLSVDADYVFDLHCDDRTSAHIYAMKHQQKSAEKLCKRLGFSYLFTEEPEGAVAFDGTHLQTWHFLQKDFPGKPFTPPKLAVTVEYRGQYDVKDQLAIQDAKNLFQYLVDVGAIEGSVEESQDLKVQVSPLEAVDIVRAPKAGLVVFKYPLDTYVRQDEVIAEIVQLDEAKPNQRIQVRSNTDGFLMGLSHRRMARPGDQIAKVAGTKSLPNRKPGQLLQL